MPLEPRVIAPSAIVTATIAAGEVLSTVIDATAASPVRLIMPEDWEGRSITFQISPDGINFFDLYDTNGIGKTIVVVPNTAVIIDSGSLGFRVSDYLRMRADLIQTAERIFTVVMVA